MVHRRSPSLGDIEALAADALATVPEPLRRHAADVVVRVEDFPDEEVCREMDLESPFDLLGLYQGVPIGDKSVFDPGGSMDMIFLYRRPILDYWSEYDEDLAALVRHVLIHEIGHHFGFSDEDMEALEAQAAGQEPG